MIDLLIGLGLGALMFGAPVWSLLIITKGHVRFYDNRTAKVIKK